jgi:hypothetical protein
MIVRLQSTPGRTGRVQLAVNIQGDPVPVVRCDDMVPPTIGDDPVAFY